MDARKERIGEHAAENTPPWALSALGPVPDHPLHRLDWQRRASSIGAWRELSGYRDPADPIGPEPVAAAPDLRAAWYEALAALGPADGPDVRGMPDGRLLHLRDTYPIETAWAPPYVGDELRQVRAAAREARLAGLRASAEAAAAVKQRRPHHRDPPAGTRGQLPRPAPGLPGARDRLRGHHGRPGRLGRATRAQRRLAVAADAELRRRHPDQHLRPAPLGRTRTATQIPSAPSPPWPAAEPPGETGQWITDLAAAHRTFAERLADRQSLTIPSPDPDYGDLGQAFPTWPGRIRMRSCSHPNPRSGRPRKSSNAPQTATPTGRPPIDKPAGGLRALPAR